MSDRGRPIVIAHRGASGYRPEHTASAYRLAVELGADAVEPDLVPTRDGVLVVRHENELSSTTDVADHPELAAFRTTKVVDGVERTGWFSEDLTWDQLSTLRCRERLPGLRPGSSAFDGREPMLRFDELLQLLPPSVTVVAEVKHASYFASIGLPLDELLIAQIGRTQRPVVIESFERTVLAELSGTHRIVFLVEASGAPADLVARDGAGARSYAEHLESAGLRQLASEVSGISVDKTLLLTTDEDGRVTGITDLARRAHDAGLECYAWTVRAENAFLPPNLRIGGNPAGHGRWDAEVELLASAGVDGIFTDQPDLVLGELTAI